MTHFSGLLFLIADSVASFTSGRGAFKSALSSKYVILLGILMFSLSNVFAQSNIAGVVNTYYEVNSVGGANVTLGSVTAGDAHTLAAGDQVVLIEMNGSNVGVYEILTVSSVAASTVSFTDGPNRTYGAGAIQLVHMPTDAGGMTVDLDVTATPWDGTVGGVIALGGSTLTLNANIDVTGLGYTSTNRSNSLSDGSTGGIDSSFVWASMAGGNGGGGGIFGGGGGGGGVNSPEFDDYNAVQPTAATDQSNGIGGNALGAAGGVVGFSGNGGDAFQWPPDQYTPIAGGGGGGSYGGGGGAIGTHFSSAYSAGGGGGGSYTGGGIGGNGGTNTGGTNTGGTMVLNPDGPNGNIAVLSAITTADHYLHTGDARLVMGGAGGLGPNVASGAGGGIIILDFETINGNDNGIIANGEDGLQSSAMDFATSGSGGGAGGQMHIVACDLNDIIFTAIGGRPGMPVTGGEHVGSFGGGGGGGGIWFDGASASNVDNTGPNAGGTSTESNMPAIGSNVIWNIAGGGPSNISISGLTIGSSTFEFDEWMDILQQAAALSTSMGIKLGPALVQITAISEAEIEAEFPELFSPNNPKNAGFGGTSGLGGNGLVVASEKEPICELSIAYTQASCTDNTDGTFTANYDLTLNWTDPPATGDLTITLTGDGTLNTSTVSATTIAGGSTTTLPGAFTVPADGNGTTTITATFDDDSACTSTFTLKAPVPCPADVSPCASTAGCIGGNVFEDFNCNGADDTEPGVQGVQIEVYDCNNNLVGTGYSDSEGDWQVCGLTDGTAYRIEHVLPESVACWATPTHVGTDNGSDIQFLTAPACTQFSVSSPSDYCEVNPKLLTTCFVIGDPDDATVAGQDVLVEFNYDGTGKAVVDVAGNVGSTWGVAFDQQNQRYFVSTVLRRHSGIADSLGTIYVADPISGTPTVFTTLSNVGTIASNTDRGLTTLTAPSQDQQAFSKIGKVGIGDIDLSEDGSTLYAVNLNTRKVVAINTTSLAETELPAFPEPGCGSGVARPWALKVYRGAIYLGLVCSGENGGSQSDLSAHIMKYENGSWSTKLSFALDYPKGCSYDYFGTTTGCGGWSPWFDDDTTDPPADYIFGYEFFSYPTPIFSDLEFTEDGSILMAFLDRSAMQYSAQNHPPYNNTNSDYEYVSGGDILVAHNVNGNLIFENNGASGEPTTTGQSNGQGPNGGEFIYEDEYLSDDAHYEVSTGGIAVLKGTNEFALSRIDPSALNSGGIGWFGSTTGQSTNTLELYAGGLSNGFMSKSAGIGDIEILCAPAPLEIGNYVWCDSLANGIQDACESGISDILVQLYDRTGALVGQDTTVNGQYYFNQNNVDTTGITVDGSGIASPTTAWSGMSYSTQYFIVFGAGQFTTDEDEFTVGGNTYGITSMANAGSNDNIDSDVDGSNLTTALNEIPADLPFIDMTTSATGCGDHKYDLGVTCTLELASLGDTVWFDENGDGIQDGGTEVGVDMVTVYLLDDMNMIIDSTVTNGVGFYEFDSLAPGTYAVQFVYPDSINGVAVMPTLQGEGMDGTVDSDADPLTGITAPVTLVAGEHNPDIDAGLTPELASLGDTVWFDENGDGIQDGGTELGVDMVTVYLLDDMNMIIDSTVTNGVGFYEFDSLAPGTYAVQFVYPDSINGVAVMPTLQGEGMDGTVDSDADPLTGITAPVTLVAGEHNPDIDAGLSPELASLGDTVWFDENGDGIQDGGTEVGVDMVTVYLLDDMNMIIDSTVTDMNGNYEFDSLAPGTYAVQFVYPDSINGVAVMPTLQGEGMDGTVDSDADPLTGITAPVTLVAGEHNPDIDAGLSPELASLGDTVWFDENGDGIQDGGTEVGVDMVTVYLLDDMNMIIDSTVTDMNGNYEFDSLAPGTYAVQFVYPDSINGVAVMPTLQGEGMDGTVDSDADPLTGITAPVTLVAGEHNPDIDAGLTPELASLGDTVWFDENGDGIQDGGTELGVDMVTVYLLDDMNMIIDSTVTNGVGFYEFDSLAPGTYAVQFVYPDSINGVAVMPTLQGEGMDGTVDSDADPLTGITAPVTLVAGEHNPDIDAGLSPELASLGDTVWFDENGDGIQDGGTELGVDMVTVYLLDDMNMIIDSTVTNGVGFYEFDSLAPGTYAVQFVYPDSINGVAVMPTLQGEGMDGTVDSDADPLTGITAPVTLVAGEHNPDIDAGLSPELASLGDTVWFDENGDGIQDGGTEVGVDMVTVYLLDDMNMIIDSTVTNGVGFYEFDGLAPGTYAVQFVYPDSINGVAVMPTLQGEGMDGTVDSDADPLTGITAPVTLVAGEHNPDIDAGLSPELASLGDTVWFDENGDGIQDGGTEVGVDMVTVYLLDDMNMIIDSTVTNGVGFYEFDGLAPGTYAVQFVYPDSINGVAVMPTLQGEGMDGTVDSDADPLTGITAPVTLVAGEHNPDIDAGLTPELASLGDTVWFDENGDGIQDGGTEVGVDMVTVYLLDDMNMIIDSTVTNGVGFYEFDSLAPGTYAVQFVYPDSINGVAVMPTLQGEGMDGTVDSDADPLTGITAPVTLVAGEHNPDIDAGLSPELASLGDTVWFDENGDGIQDGGTEVGVDMVTVYLLDDMNMIIDSTVTNGVGFYEFDGLAPGTYAVQFVYPDSINGVAVMPTLQGEGMDGTVDSDADPLTGITAPVTLVAGEHNPDIDAGLSPELASLGDTVWFDENGDGIQDGGTEVGVDMVTVYLLDDMNMIIDSTVTNGVGFYEFDGLAPGTYAVQFVYPDSINGVAVMPTLQGEGMDGTVDSDADPLTGITAPVTLVAGEHNPDIDAGLSPELASLGDTVWFDENGDGIQDGGTEVGVDMVTVYLLDDMNMIIDSTVTNGVGFYEFDSLAPGTYAVQFVYPDSINGVAVMPTLQGEGMDGTVDSDADPLTGITAPVTLVAGEHNPDIDAGLSPELASLGDTVWFDENGDGIQDGGTEVGVDMVTVYLLDDMNMIIDSTVTDMNGNYEFDSLAPGTYAVQFVYPDSINGVAVMPTLQGEGMDGTVDSDADPLTGITAPVTLVAGEHNPDIDAGLSPELASLGDTVWFDENGDGIQDGGTEVGVDMVTVYLLDDMNMIIDSTVTNGVGFYEFDSLAPGTYAVQFVYPDSINGVAVMPTLQGEGMDGTVDSDADPLTGITAPVTLVAGEHNPDIDAGLSPELASLGDTVWFDENGDGIQDGGTEVGVDMVTVYLLDDMNMIIDSTVTNGVGFYEFDSLAPGTYAVQFVYPDSINGVAVMPTLQGEGMDGTVDSDADPLTGITAPVTLVAGEHNPDIDAGLSPELASLGDTVWFDENGDGIQDGGTEVGVDMVTVYLLDDMNMIIDSTVTDMNGNYEFDSLAPGTYAVQFVYPDSINGVAVMPTLQGEGMDGTVDSDADPLTGITAPVTLVAGEHNPDIDAGLSPELASLGDTVWFDENGDGIQDGGTEVGVDMVTVYLLDDMNMIIDSTVTNGVGFYEFDSLAPGTYAVQFVYPDSINGVAVMPTLQGEGMDGTVDSDADPLTGITAPVTLVAGEHNPDIDAGLSPELASLGDTVWFDENGDGIQDGGTEVGVDMVTVYLLDDMNMIIDSTVTNGVGFYEFDSLAPGTYAVQFVYPDSINGVAVMPTLQGEGMDGAADSDADPLTGITAPVTLVAGEQNPDIDAGLTPELASLGDTVWFDENGDGIQDGGTEVGVDMVTVYLLDDMNMIIDSTVTNGVGFYEFDSLVPGTYAVQFVYPDSINGVAVMPTLQGEGMDGAADSDADPLTGITAPVTLVAGEHNPDIDAGLTPELASLGDTVWFDENGDGIQDGGTEVGVDMVTVYLLDDMNMIIDSTVTNGVGFYEFDSLAPGTYAVQFVYPDSINGVAVMPTLQGEGMDGTVDSDADPLTGITAPVTLVAGEHNPDIDAGLTPELASLGDTVWFDENGDGIQDGGTEVGVDMVTVYLLDDMNMIIDSTVTNGVGFYEFDSLAPGTYAVQFVYPDSINGVAVMPTLQGEGMDGAVDSDADPLTGITAPVTLVAGEHNPDIDAGLTPELASLGDTVWFDENGDGIQDGGTEVGVDMVTVYLLDDMNMIIDSTVTNGVGFYEFDSLAPGTYAVQFVYPDSINGVAVMPTLQGEGMDGAADSDADPLTGITAPVTLVAGEQNPDIDAGLSPELASLGDTVWFDENGDGIQDGGTEVGVDMVTVYLLDDMNMIIDSTVTDMNGNYEFDSLAPGTYAVQFVYPDSINGVAVMPTLQGEGMDGTVDSDADPLTGITAPVTLVAGEHNPDIDAGLSPELASLGDTVWFDENGDGIQDGGTEVGVDMVTVYLLDDMNMIIDSTVTDMNGNYEFDSLAPGTYAVQFVYPDSINGVAVMPTLQGEGMDGTVDSDADPLTGITAPVTLVAGEHNPDIDAGLTPELASLGDTVWFDENGDGIQDGGTEVGVDMVTVYLLDDMNMIIDSTVTDMNGNYEFDSLAPGTYAVQFVYPDSINGVAVMPTLQGEGMDGAVDSDADPLTGITAPVTLVAGEHNPDIDAGLTPELASLGDTVWFDENGDGIQDGGTEVGVDMVTVYLLDDMNMIIDSTVTDMNGNYEFDSLAPGTYAVQFVYPDSINGVAVMPTLQGEGMDGTVDSDADPLTGITAPVTLVAGEHNPDIDAGLSPELASLGDTVWFDENGDGIQDGGTEVGVDMVTVYLLDDMNMIIDSTVTDMNGNYEFDSLAPGTYAVQFVYPDSINGVAVMPTLQGEGMDGTVDSDADPLTGITAPVTLVAGEHNPDIDAGLSPELASLGDTVWFDENGDGIQDGGTEVGVDMVTVYLLDDMNMIIDSTVTDMNGNYEFDSLAPGTYAVQFVYPDSINGVAVMPTLQGEGMDGAVDSDADPLTGITAPVTLLAGEHNPDIDAGLSPELASLGDTVWFDENGDGIQDGGTEVGVDMVTVYLLDDMNMIIDSTVTDMNGNYEFDSLAPGTYAVQFVYPDSINGVAVMPTLQGEGMDGTVDSDADPLTGITAPVTLVAGEHNPDIDAGLSPELASLGDTVWFDENGDGIQDGGTEVGVDMVTVYLLDDMNMIIDSTVTNGVGFYEFDSLAPGTYALQFVYPDSINGVAVMPTLQGEGMDGAADSDADPLTGITAPVTLVAGEQNPDIDAGLTPELASLGDTVWFDENGDGIQDGGTEVGVDMVTVYLLDDMNMIIDSTVTNGVGFYEFDSLVPGTYAVQFVYPDSINGVAVMPTLQGEGMDGAADSDADPLTGITAPVTLVAGEHNPDIDAGLTPELASLGDTVWFDENGDGIQDGGTEVGVDMVTVYLLDDMNMIIDSTVTNGVGFYEFDSLAPGTYAVQFVYPDSINGVAVMPTLQGEGMDGTVDSDADPLTGITAPVTLVAGEHNPDIDAGLTPELASLGDTVWFDENGDGIQDGGTEVGVDMVTVYLLDDMNMIIDSTVTNGVGFYEFDSLAPGTYAVQFVYPDSINGVAVMPTLQGEGMDGTVDSDADPLTGITAPVTLVAGEHNPDIDAGLTPELASLGDTVWFDENGDGIQDGGTEVGVDMVTVYLLDDMNMIIDSTVTDMNGNYEFDSLAPGTYAVQFVYPDSINGVAVMPTLQGEGMDGTVDSDADPLTGITAPVTLVAGEHNPDIDAGLSPELASLGDTVWFDENGDGIQDGGTEVGVDMVTVYLLDDMNMIIDSTVTDMNGNYEFDSLAPGTYAVQFVYPDSINGVAVMPTLQGEGMDGTVDSDADPLTGITAPVTLVAGEHNPDIDAGLTPELASLGDTVWFDENGDGIQDGGTEVGVDMVTVYLLDDMGDRIDSTVTDDMGFYEFDSLAPGTYAVQFVAPDGFVLSPQDDLGSDEMNDSDADEMTGITAPITLVSGENNPDIDAGIFNEAAGLGDYVFSDNNANGMQDAGDAPIEGVIVVLFEDDGSTEISRDTTDVNGMYSFTGLDPDEDYVVGFETPEGFESTDQTGAIDDGDNMNSDADEMTGLTDVIDLDAGEFDETIDAGFVPLGTIGDYVWFDEDGDGIQDMGEDPIEGVVLILLDENGMEIARDTTDVNGEYLFEDLPAGDYTVVVGDGPENTGLTTPATDEITLGVGEDYEDADFGFVPLSGLGDTVWLDEDGDGVQDPSEPGIDSILVILTDPMGNPIDSMITDMDGFYYFPDLFPGDYIVEFVLLDTVPGYITEFTLPEVGDSNFDSNVNPFV